MPRNPRQGLTTLAALAGIFLLAVLTLTLQTRTAADLRLLSRLTDDLKTHAAKDSLTDRLRPLVAEAMAGSPDAPLKLDSTPLMLTEAGRDWEIRVQDVEGQVDLYLAPPDLLVLFEVVLREGHVGRSADRLNLSSSAVSHGLGRLREMLNDPLFIRTPKGVVPTDRALELAGPIAVLLEQAKNIISTSEPFDPTTSTRRFTIGAPDGVLAVVLAPLLDTLHHYAPSIDISFRQLLPVAGEVSIERAWRTTFSDLEARAMDIAIVPIDLFPSRFHHALLYEEDFVIAFRSGHPFKLDPSLDHYCTAQHLVVSLMGDPHGFIDASLARLGLERRVALTVPNFMFALAVVADSDLVAALPRRFVSQYGKRFGVEWAEPPLPLEKFRLSAVSSKAALMDQGVAWILSTLKAGTFGASTPTAGASA